MKELLRIRHSYETRGDGSTRFEDAHRLLRMGLAVADVVGLPIPLLLAAEAAYDRAVAFDGEDERRFTVEEVALLADVLAQVSARLDEGLDRDVRPRGPIGELITEEATRPKALADGEADDDRVFELADDGSVRTVYPRMSLFEMREDLPRLVEYFRDAAFRKLEVAIVD